MAWLAVDPSGGEFIYEVKPKRHFIQYNGDIEHWECQNDIYSQNWIYLKMGSIEKLLGRKLTWKDEPVKWDDEPVEAK